MEVDVNDTFVEDINLYLRDFGKHLEDYNKIGNYRQSTNIHFSSTIFHGVDSLKAVVYFFMV